MKKWKTLYKKDKLNKKQMMQTIQCFRAHTKHSDTLIDDFLKIQNIFSSDKSSE